MRERVRMCKRAKEREIESATCAEWDSEGGEIEKECERVSG